MTNSTPFVLLALVLGATNPLMSQADTHHKQQVDTVRWRFVRQDSVGGLEWVERKLEPLVDGKRVVFELYVMAAGSQLRQTKGKRVVQTISETQADCRVGRISWLSWIFIDEDGIGYGKPFAAATDTVRDGIAAWKYPIVGTEEARKLRELYCPE
mgnify:CR=1 FL=1